MTPYGKKLLNIKTRHLQVGKRRKDVTKTEKVNKGILDLACPHKEIDVQFRMTCSKNKLVATNMRLSILFAINCQ